MQIKLVEFDQSTLQDFYFCGFCRQKPVKLNTDSKELAYSLFIADN